MTLTRGLSDRLKLKIRPNSLDLQCNDIDSTTSAVCEDETVVYLFEVS